MFSCDREGIIIKRKVAVEKETYFFATEKWYADIEKAPRMIGVLFIVEAVWTGLEPATPCVTGMYSNRLNYQTNPVENVVCFSNTGAKIGAFP